jgi:kynurenine formamidase
VTLRENTSTPTAPVDGVAAPRPAYDELPIIEGLGLRHSWDVYGRDDDLGSLNTLTPKVVREAAAEVRTGRSYGLNLPLDEPDPPFFGREAFRHEVFALARNSWDDKVDNLAMQGSTQWDGFRHIRAREHGFYTGITDDPPEMGDRLGVQHWCERGIVGRGVLLDVERHGRETYDPLALHRVTADELRHVAEAQGVEVRPGDVLCIRFGWTRAYRGLDRAGREALAAQRWPPFVGLEAGERTARLLWDWGVAAVACDNPAVEAAPGDPALGSFHRQVLACLGLVLGELFDFEALAADSAADGRYSFLFSAVPLAVSGGVGSPANAVAIR